MEGIREEGREERERGARVDKKKMRLTCGSACE
jgi:hypothetical protein